MGRWARGMVRVRGVWRGREKAMKADFEVLEVWRFGGKKTS